MKPRIEITPAGKYRVILEGKNGETIHGDYASRLSARMACRRRGWEVEPIKPARGENQKRGGKYK